MIHKNYKKERPDAWTVINVEKPFEIREYESLMDAINLIVNSGSAAEIKYESKKGYVVVQVDRRLRANNGEGK